MPTLKHCVCQRKVLQCCVTESFTPVLYYFHMTRHNGTCVSGTGGHAFKRKSYFCDQMLLLQPHPSWFFQNSVISFSSTSPSFFQNLPFAFAALWLVKCNGKVKINFRLFWCFVFFFFLFPPALLEEYEICRSNCLIIDNSFPSESGKGRQFKKLFCLHYHIVNNSSIFPAELKSFKVN